MHKTSVLRMEEGFMADACDSENQEMQIDKPKTSGSAMASFLWFEALKFSLRVMRKSFFKLFIPAMALSFVMGAFHVLLGFVLAIGFLATCVSNPIIGSIGLVLLVLFTLPVYAFLYPLLKRYVLYYGLQELNLIHLNEYKQLPWKIRLGKFGQLLKISLKKYSFQTLSFLLLMLPIILELLLERRNVGMGIMILDFVFLSIIALLPVTWSFYAYFFAELHVIDEISQEVKTGCIRKNKIIRPNKKLFWPILSWKAILFVAYIALLFILSFSWSYIANLCDSQSCGMGNGNLFGEFLSYFTDGLKESLSPLLSVNLYFVIFVPGLFDSYHTYPSHILWIQAVFLLLFGLMTAFFFLVETLSSVYFYHGNRGSSEEMNFIRNWNDGTEEEINEHQST